MQIERDRLILGLTGAFGSGCTTVAEHLVSSAGRKRFSLSDIVKEEAKRKGITDRNKKEYRRELQNIGNELRRKKGSSYLAKATIKRIEKEVKPGKEIIVVEGFRNHNEVLEFRKFSNFYLLAVDAPTELRWERLKKDYDKDERDFDEDDVRDRGEDEEYGQQVQRCVDLADIIINNNIQFDSIPTKKAFFSKIDGYIKLAEHPGSRRPDANELMMNHAYNVSLQSSCLQRKVGAVIATEDNYVLSTGFNDVPKGDEPCESKLGKCYRKQRKEEFFKQLNTCPHCGTDLHIPLQCEKCNKNLRTHISPSKELDWCRALHAEENAILQIARLGGQSLIEAKLYSTTFPCLLCAKKVVNSGIKKVIFVEAYPIKEAKKLLEQCGISISKFEGVKAQAFYKLYKEV